MIKLGKIILYSWNFIFNHKMSPLKDIPDIAIRHYILQLLGLMCAVSFSIAISSYTFLAFSIAGHLVLISALALTVSMLTSAASEPNKYKKLSLRIIGRHRDGEHY